MGLRTNENDARCSQRPKKTSSCRCYSFPHKRLLLENWDILAECYYSANLCFEILQFCFWLAGYAGGDRFIGNPIFGKIFTIVKETLKFFAISLLSNGILNIEPLFVKS